MRRTLDELLVAMAAAPTDHRLDRLEPEVLARIDALGSPVASMFGWQVATIAFSLGIGTIVGGAGASAAAPSNAISVFSPQAALAPSYLLEGGR